VAAPAVAISESWRRWSEIECVRRRQWRRAGPRKYRLATGNPLRPGKYRKKRSSRSQRADNLRGSKFGQAGLAGSAAFQRRCRNCRRKRKLRSAMRSRPLRRDHRSDDGPICARSPGRTPRNSLRAGTYEKVSEGKRRSAMLDRRIRDRESPENSGTHEEDDRSGSFRGNAQRDS